MKVNIKVLNKDAIIPIQATDGAAGLDISLCRDVLMKGPEDQVLGHTGLAISIPKGHVGLILPRSSLHKIGLKLANTVGAIDSDYRGEILIPIQRVGFGKILVTKDMRIAQLIIVPIPAIELVEVAELDITARGEGGFGSSGG